MTTIRWGFIGAGNIARAALAPAVHASTGAVLQSVAARDTGRARALGPRGAVHDHYAGILSDPEVDAVYISLPNDAHATWAILALESGKHVLCEKPLAMNGEEIARMHAAAEQSGRLVVEATWNRWHPRTRRAEAIVRAGLIGDVTAVEAGFVIPGVPEDNYRHLPEFGGGALYDLGCYPIVASLWATGADASPLGSVVVTSVEQRRNAHGVDLQTRATYELRGARVTVDCAMDGPARQWLTVHGTEGSLDFVEDFVTSRHAPSTLTVGGPWGTRTEHFAPCDPYQLMVEQVSAAIRGEAAFFPPAQESARMMAVLESVRGAAD